MAAQLPERIKTYIENKREQVDDRLVVALYRDVDAVIDGEPGDPRLPALADRLVAHLEAVDDAEWQSLAADPMSDDLVARLDSMFLDKVPVAAELRRLPRGARLDRMDEARALRLLPSVNQPARSRSPRP